MTTPTPIRTLSHSQMETWDQCQRRWYLTKVAHVPQAPSEALIFGTAIHAAIEADGARIAAGRMALPLSYLMFEFAKGLTTEMGKADPRGLLRERVPDMRVKAIAVLRAYAEQVQPHYQPVTVESTFDVPIPGLDSWRFTGRIDAITEREGKRVIVDFKTASKPWLPAIEHHKEQATAYVWADAVCAGVDWRADASRIDQRVVTFIVLPAISDGDGGYSCTPDFRATQRYPEQIETYVAEVRRVADRITEALDGETGATEETFAARTGPLCGWCPVLGACQAGASWLAQHGRTPAVPIITTLPMVPTRKEGQP